MLTLFGYGLAGALFSWVLWTKALRWRYLAMSYAGEPGDPIEEQRFQSAVLLGLNGFNSLKGILTLGVHETGVSLRIFAPFSLFHTPLFIPYDDIAGWKTSWYLDARSVELEFRNAPDVKMIVPAEQAEWVHSFAGHKMMLRNVAPPHGNAGRGWYVFSLASFGFAVLTLAWLVAALLQWP